MKRYKADSQAKCNQILVKIVNNNEEISDAKSIASNYHICFSNISKKPDNLKFLEKIAIL